MYHKYPRQTSDYPTQSMLRVGWITKESNNPKMLQIILILVLILSSTYIAPNERHDASPLQLTIPQSDLGSLSQPYLNRNREACRLQLRMTKKKLI